MKSSNHACSLSSAFEVVLEEVRFGHVHVSPRSKCGEFTTSEEYFHRACLLYRTAVDGPFEIAATGAVHNIKPGISELSALQSLLGGLMKVMEKKVQDLIMGSNSNMKYRTPDTQVNKDLL